MAEPRLLSFLDFKFDPASGDLFRGQKRLRMPRQTCALLSILLERSGTVVSRTELQGLLWPSGEFLDYEQAINRAITDLRSILRDSPKNPRYIETVHKRGYRFLPEVSPVAVAPDPPQELTRPEPDRLADEPSQQESLLLSSAPAEIVVPEAEQKCAVASSSQGRMPRWALWAAMVFIAAVAVIAVGLRKRSSVPAAPGEVPYLGIAPFQTEGAGAEEIAESFRLDLADALAQLPVIQIRATNSLKKIAYDDNSIRESSQQLHLDLLLLGKLRVKDNLCTVQFELVRGRDSVHLASFQYNSSKETLASVRDKLQRDLFLSLRNENRSVQSVRGSTEDPEAYSEYLQARELAKVRDPGSLNQALAHYDRALQRDPNFAEAYAGMATSQLALRYFDVSKAAEHQNRAQQLARRALQLDPQLAEPHGVLGEVAYRSIWDFHQGESELRHAVELEPYKAINHIWLATLLADEGRFREAQVEVDSAIADDPGWPAVYSIATFVAGVAHDDNRMLAAVKKYLELVPDSSYSHDQLAWAYFSAKRYDEALAEWARMAELDKDASRIALEARGREAYRQGGIAAYAVVRLDAISQRSVETARHANDFIPAEWYAFAGRRDEAIAALQAIVANHDREAVQLAVNPMFDNLHSDPRFQSLLHQVGLSLPPRTD